MAAPVEFIELSDFSPGIFNDYHGDVPFTTNGPSNTWSAGQKNGAAVIENTYRCHSDKTGALTPLPSYVSASGVVNARTCAFPATTGTAYWPTGYQCWYVGDVSIVTALGVALGVGATNNGYSLQTMMSFFHAPAADGVASGYNMYTICRSFPGAGAIAYGYLPRDIFVDTSSPTKYTKAGIDLGVRIPASGLATNRATLKQVGVNSTIVTVGGIANGLGNHSGAVAPLTAPELALFPTYDPDGTGAAMIQYSSAYGGAGFDATKGCHWHYPRLLEPVLSTFEGPWVNVATWRPLYPELIITHQDRILITGLDNSDFGLLPNSTRDTVSYSGLIDPASNITTSRPFITEFGSENVSSTGVIASISVDRLFIVKDSEGGYLVSGDLNNPTIHKLPFIESTYGVSSYPAMTPIGLVYGTRNGVFLWTGGETTEKLSQQIDGFFWNVIPKLGIQPPGSFGRFCWWHPWVMVPNNFMFDTRSKAWWRLDQVFTGLPTGVASDPDHLYDMPYMHYVVNPLTGTLFAIPRLITDTLPYISYEYDSNLPATSYSWQSQPLIETRIRRRSFQQLILTATGRGAQTVTVTITGQLEDGTQLTPVVETFSWTSTTGRTKIIKQNLKANFVAMNVQIRIQVTATGWPAAKVHSLAIGVTDREQMVVTS